MRKAALLWCLALMIGSVPVSAAAVFPQLALGGGYECVVIISNKGVKDWEGGLQALQGSRIPWAVDWRYSGELHDGFSEISLTIPPKATRKVEIFGDESIKAGYLRVVSAGGSSDLDVAFSFFYRFRDARGKLTDSVGVAWELAKRDYMLPVERSAISNTGFAWVPLLSGSYDVELSLWDESGELFAEKTLEASGHLARFFTEVFEGVPEDFVGLLRFESESWLYMIALRLDYTPDGFQLTSVPPDDYIPSQQVAISNGD